MCITYPIPTVQVSHLPVYDLPPSFPARATSPSRTTAAKNSPERPTERPTDRQSDQPPRFAERRREAGSVSIRTTKAPHAATEENSDAPPPSPTMIGVGEAEGGRRHRRRGGRGGRRRGGRGGGGGGSDSSTAGHRTVSVAAQRRR